MDRDGKDGVLWTETANADDTLLRIRLASSQKMSTG